MDTLSPIDQSADEKDASSQTPSVQRTSILTSLCEKTSFFEGKKVASILLAAMLVFYLCFSAFLAVRLHSRYQTPSGDAAGYEAMVHQLLTDGTYGYKAVSNSRITPGYPFFLASIFKVTGHEAPGSWPYAAVAGTQIVCMTAMLFLLYKLASYLGNRRIGLFAVAFMLVYLPIYIVPLLMITETLALLTLVAYVFAQVVAFKKDTWKWHLLAGVLLGVTAMVRPSFAVIAPMLYLYEFFFVFKGRKARLQLFKFAFIAILGWAIVFSPWVTRNMIVFGSPDVFTTGRDDPILAGVDPYYYEMGPDYAYHGPSYKEFMEGKANGEYGSMTKGDRANEVIVEHLKSEPLKMTVWMLLGKPVRMLTEIWAIPAHSVYKTFYQIGNYLLVGAGMIGAVVTLRRRRFLPITVTFFAGLFSLILVSPEPRFVFGFIPFLAILAALLVETAWRGARLITAQEQDSSAVSR